MNCPRCLTPLKPIRHELGGVAVEAMRCRKCTGHFLETADLRQVEQVVDVRLIDWRHLPGEETQARILFCPRCEGQKAMDKVVSDRDKRVVMDLCGSCQGVWLDYGELEAIQRKGILAALADILDFIRKA
ncbi:MAG: zf-TFIIB domain-containing protein [Myxococcales bacterium]|nr:zf-TFIIB domain-containing protein [Myxococcales bacterium]